MRFVAGVSALGFLPGFGLGGKTHSLEVTIFVTWDEAIGLGTRAPVAGTGVAAGVAAALLGEGAMAGECELDMSCAECVVTVSCQDETRPNEGGSSRILKKRVSQMSLLSLD